MKRPKYVYNLYSIIGSTRELKPEWHSFDTLENGKNFGEKTLKLFWKTAEMSANNTALFLF